MGRGLRAMCDAARCGGDTEHVPPARVCPLASTPGQKEDATGLASGASRGYRLWHMEVIPHCPLCRALIVIPQIDFTEPFRCPACAEWLSVPKTYGAAQAGTAFVASCTGCFLLGLRGIILLGAAILSWFPALIIVVIVSHVFFPPRLKRWTGDDRWTILKLR